MRSRVQQEEVSERWNMKKHMDYDVDVIMAFDVVEADEPRNIRVVGEVKRWSGEMRGCIQNFEV